MTSDLPRRKAVIFGDGRVNSGSRALRISTTSKEPGRGDYVPIVFAPLEMNVTYGGVDDGCGTRQCALSLWDTAGQEDYGPLSCPETDVAVIFFTLTGPTARDSHNTVIHKYPEIKTFIPTARIVLVGTHRVVRDAYVQSTESTTASDQDRRAWIVTQE